MTAAAENDYYTRARSHAQALWDALNALKSMQRQWNALDYGNTLPDGDGINAGLVRGDVGAAVFATADAISTLMDQGHATNLARLLY